LEKWVFLGKGGSFRKRGFLQKKGVSLKRGVFLKKGISQKRGFFKKKGFSRKKGSFSRKKGVFPKKWVFFKSGGQLYPRACCRTCSHFFLKIGGRLYLRVLKIFLKESRVGGRSTLPYPMRDVEHFVSAVILWLNNKHVVIPAVLKIVSSALLKHLE